jgi:5'(3')-deoxyribonucleotidase
MSDSKIIALDVDGVIADLGTTWLGMYNKDYDDHLTNKDITRWNTHEFVKPECGVKIYDYLQRRDLYDTVLPFEGAVAAIHKIKTLGFRVIYATVTPVDCMGTKFYWLKKYNLIERVNDYIEVADKSLIRAGYLVDDRPENLDHFKGDKILFAQPWNTNKQGSREYIYLNGWQEVTDYFTHRI